MKHHPSCKTMPPNHGKRTGETEFSERTADGFRYPVLRNPARPPCRPEDLVGRHFRQILDLLVPVSGARDLSVDGYRLLNDPGTIRELYGSGGFDSTEAAPLDIYEPRIRYMQQVLASLLDIVELEFQGRPVKVDGFRLKHLSSWLSPGGGASDILAHAASRCSLNCRFCYNKKTTPALTPRTADPEAEFRSICRRIDHYLPGSGMNLFPDMAGPCEMLAHPRISEILRQLRAKTDECFRISTNGAALAGPMIETLRAAAPVYLDISVNSASLSRRRWLMQDPSPETAIAAPALLEKYHIPYSLVIVPWPFPTTEDMINDLDITLDFAAGHHPTLVQISLPGYTQSLLPRDLAFGEGVWTTIAGHVQKRRTELACPVVLRPGLFEEYTDPGRVNTPALIGVVEQSPLHRAGIRRGDRILKINGIPIKTRCQARSLLTVLHQGDVKKTHFQVLRDDAPMDFDVRPDDCGYPYLAAAVTHLGAVFSSAGIPRAWMDSLRQTIVSRSAENVLLLTSRLVRPALEMMIRRTPWFSTIDLNLAVPENQYFGGNIFMGDLLVAADMISAARRFIAENKKPLDLIVVPASPFSMSGWGRDVTGRVYLDIERELKIPVALAPCDPIFD